MRDHDGCTKWLVKAQKVAKLRHHEPPPRGMTQTVSQTMTRRAVIDVGTNSVKLLVADVAGRDVRPVWEESKQTRLGRGFYDTRRLPPEAVAKTAQVVVAFAHTARQWKA